MGEDRAGGGVVIRFGSSGVGRRAACSGRRSPSTRPKRGNCPHETSSPSAGQHGRAGSPRLDSRGHKVTCSAATGVTPAPPAPPTPCLVAVPGTGPSRPLVKVDGLIGRCHRTPPTIYAERTGRFASLARDTVVPARTRCEERKPETSHTPRFRWRSTRSGRQASCRRRKTPGRQPKRSSPTRVRPRPRGGIRPCPRPGGARVLVRAADGRRPGLLPVCGSRGPLAASALGHGATASLRPAHEPSRARPQTKEQSMDPANDQRIGPMTIGRSPVAGVYAIDPATVRELLSAHLMITKVRGAYRRCRGRSTIEEEPDGRTSRSRSLWVLSTTGNATATDGEFNGARLVSSRR